MTQIASAAFFTNRPTTTIAKALLGTQLCYQSPNGLLGGLIVETEAYLGQNDTAAHAYRGRRSAFNEPLYHEPGTIYIYQLRGFYLFDIVTQAVGQPEGVLIRALEPTIGQAQMLINRPKTGVLLTNGPGKLMAAFGIQDKYLNQFNIEQAPISIALTSRKIPKQIQATPRIGVNQQAANGKAPYRYFVAGNPYVSDLKKRAWDVPNHGWL